MTKQFKKYLSLTIIAAVSGASMMSASAAAKETKAGGNVSYHVYTVGCNEKMDEIINSLGNIKDLFTPPSNPGTPDIPETPEMPEIPVTPDIPDTPEIPDVSENGNLSAYEIRVAELVNEIREKNGLNKLILNSELSDVARLKSQDMKDNNYFSHTSPTYGSPYDMMTKFGIKYTFAGENLARGQKTPEQVVNAWMNSPGHRKNILSARYTQIGVGYVADGNYWTQHFIG